MPQGTPKKGARTYGPTAFNGPTPALAISETHTQTTPSRGDYGLRRRYLPRLNSRRCSLKCSASMKR